MPESDNRLNSLLRDFAPPANPTRDQQHDALRKGLGRAALWAKSGQLDEHALRNACLHDLRYDAQVDKCRGQWLWQLLSMSNSVSKHREPILSSLRSITEERNVAQLCQLVVCFGQSGDREFVDELYRFVERAPFPDSPWLGMEELLQLDNERAFQFLARHRGAQLASSEWEWYDDLTLERATELLGKQTVSRILSQSEDAEIIRYREKQPQITPHSKSRPEMAARQWNKRLESFSVSDAITAARSGGQVAWISSWGKQTNDDNLDALLEQLWTEEEPSAIVNMLRAFSARPLPKFDTRLMELCQHADAEVQRWAMAALSQNRDPQIRTFAIDELKTANDDHRVVELLAKNFEPGDEELLLQKLTLPEQMDELHWMLTALVGVLENNSRATAKDLGIVVYFHSPCQKCRCDAVRLLTRQAVAPDWLIEEAAFDADEECRSLVKRDGNS